MAELLPCPFCGEKLVQDKFGNWEHIANDCILSWLDSEYGKIFFGNCEEDIRAWNTRTPKERDVQEVRHGHWKFGCDAMNGQSLSECQHCGGCFWQTKEDPFGFCPNCGALMDDKEAEEKE